MNFVWSRLISATQIMQGQTREVEASHKSGGAAAK